MAGGSSGTGNHQSIAPPERPQHSYASRFRFTLLQDGQDAREDRALGAETTLADITPAPPPTRETEWR